MSCVSTIVVSVPTLDYHGQARELLLDKDMAELGVGCSGGKLEADRNYWGGTKAIQADLLVGGFNYLDENAFLRFVGGLRWIEPAWVQVFIKGEHSPIFLVYTGVKDITKAGTPLDE